MMDKRQSGILLHITSLPSEYGIGDLGPKAYRFADFLADSGQRYWQILPLTSTNPVLGNSPYSSFSAFGGNVLLVSPELLIRDGLLDAKDVFLSDHISDDKVIYEKVGAFKNKLLNKVYEKSKDKVVATEHFKKFCERNAYWLDAHCEFVALKAKFEGIVWKKWPKDLCLRHPKALDKARRELADEILYEKFRQYIFHDQWARLRTYCNKKNIQIVGDIPIYVHYDSADVWANPDVFKLDKDRLPTVVSGVPPDYFSKTGQLWRNPVYDWDYLQKTDYTWWKQRFTKCFQDFDIVRVDHFRGFVAFWEVKANARTAIKGVWAPAPAEDFFKSLMETFKPFPIIAEDLGIITDDVKALMKKFHFPGMRLFLFGFEAGNDKENPNSPENIIEECLAYTGTHDNNTVKGWFETEAKEIHREKLKLALKKDPSAESIAWDLVTLVMMSKANTAILPLQDILGLGGDARMNTPSVKKGNWGWRLRAEQLNEGLGRKLFELTRASGRT